MKPHAELLTADSPLVLLYNLKKLHACPLDGVEHLWSGTRWHSPVNTVLLTQTLKL